MPGLIADQQKAAEAHKAAEDARDATFRALADATAALHSAMQIVGAKRPNDACAEESAAKRQRH